MLINFKNLCYGDVEEYLRGNELRFFGHLLVEPIYLSLNELEIGKQKCYVLTVGTPSGPDPKIHFRDEQKAEEFYQLLSTTIANGKEGDYVEYDVLNLGAI